MIVMEYREMNVKPSFVSHNGKVVIIFIALGIVVPQHDSTHYIGD